MSDKCKNVKTLPYKILTLNFRHLTHRYMFSIGMTWEMCLVYCLLSKPWDKNTRVKGTLLEMNEVPNEAISKSQSSW